MNTPEQMRHIWTEWHEATITGNWDRMRAIYDDDAIFESPTVVALGKGTEGEKEPGVIVGGDAIVALLEEVATGTASALGGWFRSNDYLATDSLLIWEYPSVTPSGRQAGLVESMDVVDGLIAYHRVYWGWVGVRALLAERPPANSLPGY